ncbi:MAG: DUF5793 family protein [Natronomonas sp.]
MRRDYFTTQTDGVDSDETSKPTLTVSYEGPDEQLRERLDAVDGDDGDGIDITYRLRDPLDADDAEGVLAFTNRITGEYVLEINLDADTVLSFVDAAVEYGDEANGDGRYRTIIKTEQEPVATFDESTLLVYDSNGDLLRGRSLIPSGVEL